MMSCDIFKRRNSAAYRTFCGFLAFTFLFSWVLPPAYAQVLPQTLLNLPVPGAMVSPTPGFTPLLVKGIIVHPENPLQFDFIVDPGDSRLKGEELRAESTRLIKYFLASLTVPEDELWVNLSPYEKDRTISDILSQTEMGRDMLAQDYILKQLTASLMYPEKELGRKFWERVYKKAQEQFGTTEIPLNTFNKVWIVPEKAVVYQHEGSVPMFPENRGGVGAFVVESRLRVMLEQDYVAMQHNPAETPAPLFPEGKQQGLDSDYLAQKLDAGSSMLDTRESSSIEHQASSIEISIIKEIILPEIEKEVNAGETFARLRQVYNSMILAAWYKQNLRETLLGQVYVNRAKIKGVDVDDKEISQKIYNQYLEAFKKGVYNYIREDDDPATHETIPRKYFSGGVNASPLFKLKKGVQITKNPAGLSLLQRRQLPDLQAFIVRTDVVEATDRNAEAVREAEEAAARVVQTAEADKDIAASPIEESPRVGIQKQKENLQRAMREFNGHYYDVVFLVVDEFSYPETVELVERLRGKVIPEQANVQIVRQAEGKINGNWSAIINILLNDEHWNKINAGFYRNIAVILSAGTGTRNYPLTAAGYADKGKQFAANGRTYIEQQFKQIMQYFQEDREGMVIVSNDGIKAVSKEVKLGDGQEIQFLGSTLPIRDPRLNGLGTALVDGSVTTEGKPLKKFVEKGPLLERIKAFYGIEVKDPREAETAAKRILKAIEAGTEEEKMVPTNWADYNLSLRALEGARNVYQGLKDAQGVHLYLKYGLDTAGDLFESTTMPKETYVAAKKKWAAEDAAAVWEAAKKLRDDFGFGFVSTGGKAIFVDTGTNEVFTEAAQELLRNEDLRELLDVGEPINGRLIGENVVLGKDVKVEEGVVIHGNVVINKGHIKKGAVIINAVVDELYAEENTLTYAVEAPAEVVYVKKNNLVSDIFFKRSLYAIPTDIERRPRGRVYDLVTQDARTPQKRPRIIGALTMDESGAIIEQPSINLEEISGDELVMKAKIRVHMPLKLTSKDFVREYRLMYQGGVLAQILSVKREGKGEVETIRDYVPYIPLTAALKQQLEEVLGAMVYENFDVIAHDDKLYRVEPIGDASALWDVMVWPRKSEYENRYIWPSREGRVIRLSFAELSQFNDKETTREFLEKILPETVHHAKQAISSPVTGLQDYLRDRQAAGGITPAEAEFTIKGVNDWLTRRGYPQKLVAKLRQWIADQNWAAITQGFYRVLEFGTAGKRGTQVDAQGDVLPGPNYINDYTVAEYTLGLARYLLKTGQQDRGVVLGGDTRIKSILPYRGEESYVELQAKILRKMGIKVYRFKEPRSIGHVAWTAVENDAASMEYNSASHNMWTDNGVKASNEFGAQLFADERAGILEEIRGVEPEDIAALNLDDFDLEGDRGQNPGMHVLLGSREDQERDPSVVDADSGYIEANRRYVEDLDVIRRYSSQVHSFYTPIQGAGVYTIPHILTDGDDFQFHVVLSQEQKSQDGEGRFNTVEKPDPNYINENTGVRTLDKALREAEEMEKSLGVQFDFVFGTDPDADRSSYAVRDRQGKWKVLKANDVWSLFAWYRLTQLTRQGKLKTGTWAIETWVTTDLIADIVQDPRFDLKVLRPAVGFNKIAEVALREIVLPVLVERHAAGDLKELQRTKVLTLEKLARVFGVSSRKEMMGEINTVLKEFLLFGAEESNGYSPGGHTLEKDGAVAAVTFHEIAAFVKYINHNKEEAGRDDPFFSSYFAALSGRDLTIDELLNRVYLQYGYYATENKPLAFDGLTGNAQKSKVLQGIAEFAARVNEGEETVTIGDKRVQKAFSGKEQASTENVQFNETGYKFMLGKKDYIVTRPSGTEPYIRFYGQKYVPALELSWDNIEVQKRKADHEIEAIVLAAQRVFAPVSSPAAASQIRDNDEEGFSAPTQDLESMAFLPPDKKVLKLLENRWRRGQRGAVSLAEIMDLTGLEKEFVLAALRAINTDFKIPFLVEPAGLNKKLDKETLWVQLVARRPVGESRPPQQGLRPGAASPLDKLGTSSPRQGRGSSPLGASEDTDEMDSMVENSGMPGLPSESVRREQDYPPKSTEIQDPYKEIISDSRIPGSSPMVTQGAGRELGGINLDPALLDLQIKRDANFVPLPLPQQPIDQMNIEGFIPVIIHITPVTNLPLLLGLADTQQDRDETRPAMKAREVEEVSALN